MRLIIKAWKKYWGAFTVFTPIATLILVGVLSTGPNEGKPITLPFVLAVFAFCCVDGLLAIILMYKYPNSIFVCPFGNSENKEKL